MPYGTAYVRLSSSFLGALGWIEEGAGEEKRLKGKELEREGRGAEGRGLNWSLIGVPGAPCPLQAEKGLKGKGLERKGLEGEGEGSG